MKVPLLDLRLQYAAIREEIRAAIDEVADAQTLVLGKVTEGFEQELADYCQAKHAIGVSSGTDAILIALMAMDIGPGDEVIVPPFTFFATAGCVSRVGAKPVFVDIEPETFNLDPSRIEAAITERTRAIMPVHLYGQSADMTAINAIACRNELPVIEDAAQAIGAEHHRKRVGSLGFAAALSFYPTKNLGAFGDAGAVTTNDDELARKLRLLRVHGSGHTYHHELLGGNFRIDAIQAAVLSVKLKHLPKWHAARQRNAAIYDEAFADTPITRPTIAPENVTVYNQYVVRVPNRDAVKQKLADAGVGSAVYYPISLHLQPCFADLGHAKGDFPESERATEEVLAMPIFPELSESQVRYAAEQVVRAVEATTKSQRPVAAGQRPAEAS